MTEASRPSDEMGPVGTYQIPPMTEVHRSQLGGKTGEMTDQARTTGTIDTGNRQIGCSFMVDMASRIPTQHARNTVGEHNYRRRGKGDPKGRHGNDPIGYRRESISAEAREGMTGGFEEYMEQDPPARWEVGGCARGAKYD